MDAPSWSPDLRRRLRRRLVTFWHHLVGGDESDSSCANTTEAVLACGMTDSDEILALEPISGRLVAVSRMYTIPGVSRPASIQDCVRAADLELTADEISKLSDAE